MTVAKKVTKKSRNGSKPFKAHNVLESKNVKAADYNPRYMSDETQVRLNTSVEEFQDISGITWNLRTTNIITGHHRWKSLLTKYGEDKLSFEHIKGERYAILADGVDTGFTLRQVDWSEKKEKAANIAANSGSLQGEFTADLQGLLSELKLDTEETGSLFFDLGFDSLSMDMDSITDDDEWESDITVVEKTESNLDGIISTIKIDLPQEMRSDVFILITELIEKEGLSGKVKLK